MAVNFINQLLASIILVSLFQVVFLNENDGCPEIKVKKDEIIRTKESLDKGAQYLHKGRVQSARDCYELCCKHDHCNLGMLSYKNDSNGHLVRSCFLFNCGSPSKCLFSTYKHYATIAFEDRKKTESSQSQIDHSQTSSEQGWDNDCPPGAPVALCLSNPCDKELCRRHPWAICRPSTCGTCHAEFFNSGGQRVNCYNEYRKPLPPVNRHPSSNKWSDKTIAKEIEHLHQSHQPANRDRNHNIKTHPQDYTKQKPSQQRSSSNDIDEPNAQEETDPPFHKWREFIDNNPKFGKPKLVTEKPTEKPTTFHHWREFIDNNPKYAKRTPQKKTTPTTKPATKPTRKPTKSPVIPKTKPVTTAEHLLTVSPPKIDDDNRKRGNISDVVVIETSNLRIIESKAVVPLAIFLVVALVMLFVVVLRLRVVKTRLRRKAFATDDADYLINGMYL